MQIRPAFVYIAIFCLLAVHVAMATPSNTTCDLPPALQKKISMKYPGAHIATLADLGEQSGLLFQKEHGTGCPGLVKVNFYGDGRPTWALVLSSGENPKRKAELVVAHQVEHVWEFRSLETTDGSPVVWRERAGKYDDLDGEQTIRATRPVIVFAGYGSWAVVYAWNGKDVRKIQISD